MAPIPTHAAVVLTIFVSLVMAFLVWGAVVLGVVAVRRWFRTRRVWIRVVSAYVAVLGFSAFVSAGAMASAEIWENSQSRFEGQWAKRASFDSWTGEALYVERRQAPKGGGPELVVRCMRGEGLVMAIEGAGEHFAGEAVVASVANGARPLAENGEEPGYRFTLKGTGADRFFEEPGGVLKLIAGGGDDRDLWLSPASAGSAVWVYDIDRPRWWFAGYWQCPALLDAEGQL